MVNASDRKPLVLRPAEPADARAIAEFIAFAEEEMLPFYTGTDDPQKSLEVLTDFVQSPVLNRFSIANHIVADLGGTVVGSILAFPSDQQPVLDQTLLEFINRHGHNLQQLFFEGIPGTYYLCTVGVSPHYRGRGLGRKLMDAALKRGRQLGFRQASLLVSRKKPKAKALYQRVGFKVSEEVRIGPFIYHRMIIDME